MPEQMKTVWGDVSDRKNVPFRLMAFGDIDGAVGWWELSGRLQSNGQLEVTRLEQREKFWPTGDPEIDADVFRQAAT